MTAMKKAVAATILVLAMLLSSVVFVQSVHSKTVTKIVIRQSGSIDPSTAPIVRHGETYVLTGDIRTPIVLERGGTVLDGSGFSLVGGGGGVGLNMTCSNATLQNLNIIDWQDGILGIFNNNTIQNCMVTQCDDSAIGIFAQDYTVIRNNIVLNDVGIVIGQGGHNFIAGNNILNNYVGISLWDSNNEIVQNNIENCSRTAIILDLSGWSQIVYHNNFVNNLKEISDDAYSNSGRPVQASLPAWDNGLSGNYWSDYTGIDVNGDGIGDSPNMITTYIGANETEPSSFVDRYPLAAPFNINLPIPPIPANIASTSIPPKATIANDKATALSFMKNVIQLDTSKYAITLSYDTEGANIGVSTDYLGYGLVQKTSPFDRTVNAIFAITNNTVTSFSIQPTGGQLFFTTSTTNSFDSAKRIMQNDQTWTHDSDVNKMVSLLNKAGSEKNAIELLDNIELKVSTTPEQTQFSWSYTYNGADYSSVNLEFQNLYGLQSITFSDNRGIYTVGNTNVSVSKQQAIQIADNYVRSLSYQLDYGNGSLITVKGLTINETDTTANLSTTSQDSVTLCPCWSVQVPLAHNYPEKTYAVSVSVWAGNGTVFSAQRNVVPKNFPVSSSPAPFWLIGFLPVFGFTIFLALLIYFLVMTTRRSRTHREMFVSGRTPPEIKDEALRWFSQNRVNVTENRVGFVKGRWGAGLLTAPKHFQVYFTTAEGGVKVYVEGWISFLGAGEQNFSRSAVMGAIPRREGWRAMGKTLFRTRRDVETD